MNDVSKYPQMRQYNLFFKIITLGIFFDEYIFTYWPASVWFHNHGGVGKNFLRIKRKYKNI